MIEKSNNRKKGVYTIREVNGKCVVHYYLGQKKERQKDNNKRKGGCFCCGK